MKKIFALVLVVLLTVLTLCGCVTKVEDYYDNDRLLRGNKEGYMSVMSVVNYKAGILNFSAGSFTGCKRISKITITAHEHFDYDLKIESGKFKLVLVSADGTVNTIFESTGDDISNTMHFTAGAGDYIMKLVGQDAKGVVLSVEIGAGTH